MYNKYVEERDLIIQGLQKMTLLDYPEHVACTVFLGGCDFRCPFCHNYELVERSSYSYPDDPMTTPGEASALEGIDEVEFFKFLAGRKGLLDGVAITGGEPCLRRDLPEFIVKIKELGFKVKLDTNGNHPEMLAALLKQNLLDYVAMDIKNSPEKYAETAGLMALDLDQVKSSIQLLLKGQVDYEFRTTVISQLHEEDDFHKIGELVRGAKKHFLQPFVDREFVPDHSLTPPENETLHKYSDILSNYVEAVAIRGLD